ncbi:hypothetical protein ACR9E3_23810 [Actinomycetospora sp. C-140]
MSPSAVAAAIFGIFILLVGWIIGGIFIGLVIAIIAALVTYFLAGVAARLARSSANLKLLGFVVLSAGFTLDLIAS